jgi:thiamine-phosphate pyrophosphorylase
MHDRSELRGWALPRLYAVVDADACTRAGREPLAVADAFLAGGATLLQWRAKSWESGPLYEAAAALVARAGAAARIVVNDRADVAALIGAAGVHLGQDDLPVAAARAICGPAALIGLSTHTDEQLAAALAEPVSYVAVGPVFATTTKDTGYDPLGLAGVERRARQAAARGIPLVAIGGISLDRAPAVIDAGASAVCVISDLLVGNPATRVAAYLRALG